MEPKKTKEEIEAEVKLKEELDGIASKYGAKAVFKIIAHNTKQETATAYFKKPDRNMMGVYSNMNKRNPINAKETILRTCYLEGDDRILSDDDFFYSACTEVDDIISIQSAELKKNY
jgi:hypothetical protein